MVKVALSTETSVATQILPRDVERAVTTRESGVLDPPPALLAKLARDTGTSETKVRSRLLSRDSTLDDAIIEALGSPDDRLALAACAWMCAGNVDASLPERAFRGEAAEGGRDRRRALAAIAATCTGKSTTLAREALREGGPAALGGAYGLWRLGVPLSEAEAAVLPAGLAAALTSPIGSDFAPSADGPNGEGAPAVPKAGAK